mmetsp:Transcript_33256/g.61204  ORF Transcript_33256/g.61204 Transcript_33256/m.61204 type:complete len:114 (+) Transcript_33256:386-727(+)
MPYSEQRVCQAPSTWNVHLLSSATHPHEFVWPESSALGSSVSPMLLAKPPGCKGRLICVRRTIGGTKISRPCQEGHKLKREHLKATSRVRTSPQVAKRLILHDFLEKWPTTST